MGTHTNFGVGLLGFGTVGTGVYNLLLQKVHEIQNKYGFRFEVKKILVKNPKSKKTASSHS